jgi:hypothetical protein
MIQDTIVFPAEVNANSFSPTPVLTTSLFFICLWVHLYACVLNAVALLALSRRHIPVFLSLFLA